MNDKERFNLDIRVIERYIREGRLKREEYEEYLNNLPDITDKGCPLTLGEEVAVEEAEANTESQEEEK